jgi:hypothetical protein
MKAYQEADLAGVREEDVIAFRRAKGRARYEANFIERATWALETPTGFIDVMRLPRRGFRPHPKVLSARERRAAENMYNPNPEPELKVIDEPDTGFHVSNGWPF